MAPGIFGKLVSAAKKVGGAIKEVAPKVLKGVSKAIDYAAPVAQTVGTMLQQTGNPTFAGVGTALTTGANMAQQGRAFLEPLMKLQSGGGGGGGNRRRTTVLNE